MTPDLSREPGRGQGPGGQLEGLRARCYRKQQAKRQQSLSGRPAAWAPLVAFIALVAIIALVAFIAL
eukprot:9861297-Lingulodinium_polyedra.AAC.1